MELNCANLDLSSALLGGRADAQNWHAMLCYCSGCGGVTQNSSSSSTNWGMNSVIFCDRIDVRTCRYRDLSWVQRSFLTHSSGMWLSAIYADGFAACTMSHSTHRQAISACAFSVQTIRPAAVQYLICRDDAPRAVLVTQVCRNLGPRGAADDDARAERRVCHVAAHRVTRSHAFRAEGAACGRDPGLLLVRARDPRDAR